MLTLNISKQHEPGLHLDIIRESDMPTVNLKPKRTKYTYDIFLQRARALHGEKFDYTLVNPEMITGVHAKLPLICNKCKWQWESSIDNHLRGRKCPMCAGRFKWTRDLLIQRAIIIHGNKYNYDNVTSNIRNQDTKINIVCNKCTFSWESSIGSHINNKNGCARCSKRERWTYDRFIQKSTQVHGGKYDYTKINPEIKITALTLIPVLCRSCNFEWKPSVQNHVSGHNCPVCMGNAPWTLERFLEKAAEIHGNKYNYDNIKSEHIQGYKSKILIKCHNCTYEWMSSIDNHINGKCKCPRCAKMERWTGKRFMNEVVEIHGNKYDYDLNTVSHIRGAYSVINIICMTCNYKWSSAVSNHTHNKSGCPNCAGKAPWNLDRLITKGNKIHNNKYDYSLIGNRETLTSTTYVKLRCKSCNYIWNTSIANHIYNRCGCPKCRFSKGELQCEIYLSKMNIEYTPQFNIPSLPRKRYDFMFEIGSQKYILEYDGEQHFSSSNTFGRDKSYFEMRRYIDVIKTQKAIDEGFKMIRIDYTQITNIEFHITKGILSENNVYCSTDNIYHYITDNLTKLQ